MKKTIHRHKRLSPVFLFLSTGFSLFYGTAGTMKNLHALKKNLHVMKINFKGIQKSHKSIRNSKSCFLKVANELFVGFFSLTLPTTYKARNDVGRRS